MSAYRYLFGPVQSRRFGRSLGVDLVPPKTCSLNCIFCQLGATPATTLERRACLPIDAVLEELDRWLAAGDTCDTITLAGSGEPTLHPDFSRVLAWVQAHRPLRSLLLSNGTLFTNPTVRTGAALADQVKVSLHAADQATFERIVRPHPGLLLEKIVEGFRQFRGEYSGELVVEVMLVPGVNDQPEALAELVRVIARVQPDRVQLNTPVRPPAEPGVGHCSQAEMVRIAAMFTPCAEVAGEREGATAPADLQDGAHPPVEAAPAGEPDPLVAIEALVRRHPVTVNELATQFGLAVPRLRDLLQDLAANGRIGLKLTDRGWVAGPP